MDNTYHIDGHKLIYHPVRVGQWRKAGKDWEKLKKVYPVYLEISPTGACNHRCVFCALDYIKSKGRRLDASRMGERLEEMGRLGVKSVMFAGEGEPLLYKKIHLLTASAAKAGIQIAFSTNGVFLDDMFLEKSLRHTSWLKVSFNAGTAETYAKLHGTEIEDFTTVLKNVRRAVQFRDRNALDCTLGMQLILLPENAHELTGLARLCRDDLGVDYLVVKPYSQHRLSETRLYENLDYDRFRHLEHEISSYSNERFQVVFRARAMDRAANGKSYRRCYSTPFFWAYIDSCGDLYSCSSYLGDPRFSLGNIIEQSFREVWEGEKRRSNYQLIVNKLDIGQCRLNCRMDSVNEYLWKLVHPVKHVNFI